MKKGTVIVSILVLLGLLLSSCAPEAVSSPQAAAPAPKAEGVAPAPAAPAKPAWEVEWERLVAAAKKEGTVVVTGTVAGAPGRIAVSEGFKAAYGIKVEAIVVRGGEASERIARERRAGIYTFDVYIGGTTTIVIELIPNGVLDPLEPVLLLPEVTDPKKWWRGELDWVDKGHYTLAFSAYPKPPLLINTSQVKPEEIKSYKDLLNPKWKGKLVMNDPTIPGAGSKWSAVAGSQLLGWDFLRELAKQEPILLRDQRLQVEWVAQGKYPVAIGADTPPATEFRKAGASIAWLTPAEGTHLTAGHGTVSLINRAPHPNAARLFINWLLTREAQERFSRMVGAQSGRVDAAADFLDPAEVRDPKARYILAYHESFVINEPEYMKRAKEIFAPLAR